MLCWNYFGEGGGGGVPLQNTCGQVCVKILIFDHFRESLMAILKVITEINKLLKRFNKNTRGRWPVYTKQICHIWWAGRLSPTLCQFPEKFNCFIVVVSYFRQAMGDILLVQKRHLYTCINSFAFLESGSSFKQWGLGSVSLTTGFRGPSVAVWRVIEQCSMNMPSLGILYIPYIL